MVEADRRVRQAKVLIVAFVLLVLVVVGIGLVARGGSPGPTSRIGVADSAAGLQPTVVPVTPATPIAADSGSRQYATGTAEVLAPGKYRYVAAKEDTLLGIASRFHVCVSDLDGTRPLADQGAVLTPRTPITVQLGHWPLKTDGTVDCVWDGPDLH